MRTICLICMLCLAVVVKAASPIQGLLERIDKGASRKFVIEQVKSPTDFFELDQKGDKVVIRGNNYVSIATGVNWYLKYYAGIQLSWNGMTAQLPAVLPAVPQKERHETDLKYRYDFNYCTYSYTMAFWDWDRWEKEIDWMALHGINLPLAVVGADVVWYNVLTKLGYTKDEINEFIAGPAFQGWWLMNNLEGWGGPNPDSWYKQRETLQKQILKRMREYGIRPVLPGYSGMVPHNAKERLGLNVSDPGLWCGYRRPAFLQPTDPRFNEIADLYYKEMSRLYGKADFYSMDPFHEGGNVAGVDLNAAGQAIWGAMKKANPKAVWVAQAWQANPRQKMIENLPAGDLIVLDLFAESRPQWGDPESTWYRKEGFGKHDWLYCMLLNFGGNVGLHGRMNQLVNGYYDACAHTNGKMLHGVGATPEGIENNPVMFELLYELPWREERFSSDEWLQTYLKARYGREVSPEIMEAWRALEHTVYNAPKDYQGEGTIESLLCARPGFHLDRTSTWGYSKLFYAPDSTAKAARLFTSVADQYKGNNNFEYDLVDIVRQSNADKGNVLLEEISHSYDRKDKEDFRKQTQQFLDLILAQDRLLSTRKEFSVSSWLNAARSLGTTEEEKRLYEWNASALITVWGDSIAANQGGLHDYSHREWSGLLKDLYYQRWKAFFEQKQAELDGKPAGQEINFYGMEKAWAEKSKAQTLKN